MLDNDVNAKVVPKILSGGNVHDSSIEQIHDLYLFCFCLLELPELLRLAILDLVRALTTSL